MPQITAEEFLRRKRKVTAEEFLRQKRGAQEPQQPAPASVEQPPGFFGNIGIGLERLGAKAAELGLTVSDYVQGIQRGDVRPGLEIAELAGRGYASASAQLRDFITGSNRAAEVPGADAAAFVAAKQAQAQRRLTESPYAEGFKTIEEVRAEANRRAALDPSLTGKLIRGGTQFVGEAAPAVLTGIATGGSLPAIAATTAFQSLGEPETLPLNVVASVVPVPIGKAFRPILSRIRGAVAAADKRIEATAAAQAAKEAPVIESAAAKATTEGTGPAAVQGASTATQPVDALQSAFAKLGTDDANQIGKMIASANRRFVKRITPEVRQQAVEDWNVVKTLTQEEHDALGKILPVRTYAPVTEAGKTQHITDIPLDKMDAQLQANLRELDAFFTAEGRAAAPLKEPWQMTPDELREIGLTRAEANQLGAWQDMGKIARDAAKTQNAFLREKGMTIEDARALNPTGRERLQAEYTSWLKTQEGAPSVVDAISAARRTPTSPVLLSDVRAKLPGVGKAQFDDEVKAAVENGEIFLHRHDAPGQLSATEKSGMVKIGDDYYGAATVNGPRVESAAFEVPGATAPPAPRTPGTPPPELTGKLFEQQPVQQALIEGARDIPQTVWQRIKNEFLGGLGAAKSLKSAGDISAMLRQGGIYFLRPFQIRQSAKATAQMFRAFKEKNYNQVHEAINALPERPLMDAAGLERSGPGVAGLTRGEEGFLKRAGSWISRKVSRLPGVKQSDQAYTTMLDVQRVERLLQYKRVIDKMGLSPEEAMKGFQFAAKMINISTGRGSLGKTFDKWTEGLNFFFFSPKFTASRINLLNPFMYGKMLASGPAGRAVLRGHEADLAQYASMVAVTMYGLKQAGADISFNPDSPDFLKAKFGKWHYDMGAGLTQLMRLYYRLGGAAVRAGYHRKKPEFGKSVGDIGETFLSYKLSPPAAFVRDWFAQETMRGKPFTYTRAAADMVAPMQMADFVDAFAEEGWGGVLKSTPGVPGVSVQHYETKPRKRKRGRQ